MINAAVEPLVAALKYKNEYDREQASVALGKIGDNRAVEPVIIALKDKNANVRKSAAEALGKLDNSIAVEPLIFALKDEDGNVRTQAAKSLDILNWKADENEQALYFVASQNWGKCVEIGKYAINPLIVAVKDQNSSIRENAAEALTKIGSLSVEPLIAMLKNECSDIRVVSAVSLGKIGDRKAIPQLVITLRDWHSNKYAAEALQRLGWQAQTVRG